MQFLSKVMHWLLFSLVVPAIVIYYILTVYMFKGQGHRFYGYEVSSITLSSILGAIVLGVLVAKGYKWYQDYQVAKKFKLVNKVYLEGDNVKDVLFTSTGLVYFEEGKNQLVILHKNKHKQEIPLTDVDSISIFQGGRMIGEKTKESSRLIGKATMTSLKSLSVEIQHKQNTETVQVEFMKGTKFINRRKKVEAQLLLMRDWYSRFGDDYLLFNQKLTKHTTKTEIVG